MSMGSMHTPSALQYVWRTSAEPVDWLGRSLRHAMFATFGLSVAAAGCIIGVAWMLGLR